MLSFLFFFTLFNVDPNESNTSLCVYSESDLCAILPVVRVSSYCMRSSSSASSVHSATSSTAIVSSSTTQSWINRRACLRVRSSRVYSKHPQVVAIIDFAVSSSHSTRNLNGFPPVS
eukprot:GHVT01014396.1.p1 GENE.GHVT01014396.1~~GHVT01014396.1.p1  ORF type:complete len:117 (+),score=2.99 GHVT01014396.1:35-385(+)